MHVLSPFSCFCFCFCFCFAFWVGSDLTRRVRDGVGQLAARWITRSNYSHRPIESLAAPSLASVHSKQRSIAHHAFTLRDGHDRIHLPSCTICDATSLHSMLLVTNQITNHESRIPESTSCTTFTIFVNRECLRRVSRYAGFRIAAKMFGSTVHFVLVAPDS